MSQGFTKSTAIIDAVALIGDTLAPNVLISSLTAVGALDTGSIVPGFGPIDMAFTATGDGQAVLRLGVDAAGFADVNAIDTFYGSGALAAGERDDVFAVNIDGSAAAGGAIVGLAVLATVGLATVAAVGVGTGVAPVVQRSGTFGDMDSALVNAVDRLTEFTTPGVDIQMFVANGDTVTIGNTTKFQEIEFLLAIVASNPGIKPTFDYSDGVGGFIPFVPVDGTDGMRNNGVIAWDDADLVGWAQESGEFLIRITRTAAAAITPPTEDLVQISSTTLFSWDKDGNVSINDLALAGILGVTGLASFQDVEVALTLAVTGAATFTNTGSFAAGAVLIGGTGSQAEIILNGIDGDIAAGSVGLFEAGGTLHLSARSGLTVFIDNDANASNNLFQIIPNVATGGTAVFSVGEAGDTIVSGDLAITGDVTLTSISGAGILAAIGAAGEDGVLQLLESGNTGFELRYDGGDNLLYLRGGTSGSFINEVFNVNRTTGAIAFADAVSVAGALAVTGAITAIAGIISKDGLVGAPSYAFINSPTMGMFRISSNNLGFSTGGTLGITLDNNQNVILAADLAITGETGLGIAVSASAFGTFGAVTTAKASARLPHGSAPTSPVDGDLWTTTSALFARINGVTKEVAFV